MAENRKGKENRLYFSRGQMVLLGGAFVLASLVIFCLGIIIGKSIEERKITKAEEPLIKIPVKPEASAAGAVAAPKKDEITFNSDPASKTPSVPMVDENAKEAPTEKVAKVEPAPKVAKKTEKAVSEDGAKKSEAEAGTTPENNDQAKAWRAQVNAFPDERSAKQLVDRLKNKGYNAYVSEAQNKGKTWYRVNVGRFGSREEADKIAEALRTKENYPKAFVASK